MVILRNKCAVVNSAKTVVDLIMRKVRRKNDIHAGVRCHDVYRVYGICFLYNGLCGAPKTPYIGFEGIARLELHIVFRALKRRSCDRVVDFV